jgi:hypothetical protein
MDFYLDLSRVPDVDAFNNLLLCIKLLVINAETLEAANKEQKGFLIYCLEKLLIPRYAYFLILLNNSGTFHFLPRG